MAYTEEKKKNGISHVDIYEGKCPILLLIPNHFKYSDSFDNVISI